MALVIGHSHTDCVRKAAADHGLTLNCVQLWVFGPPILRNDGVATLQSALMERLEPVVIAMIGGAAHDLIGLLQHPRPFDFVLPEQPDLPMIEGAEVIPYPTIVATLEALIGPDEAELAGLIAATGSRVVQLESPPPPDDSERLSREVDIMGVLWKRPPENGYAASPAWLRYKLWRAHSAIVRARCRAGGVEFMPAPAEALVDGAFLAPEYYGYPCHANGAYGALLLRQQGMLP